MKRQNTLISILIINYNNAKLIKRSINSCLKQTYKKLEILIYDDKSIDNSKSILKQYSKNKNIKIFFNKKKKKKIPAIDAMNGYLYLFRKSKGSIIFLLDSDDYFHKEKVLKIKKLFDNKNIQFVQNLPKVKNKQKILSNSQFSFWPYLAPESCISFRRNLMIKFTEVNKSYINEFNNIWLGFRIGVFAFFNLKKFYTIYEQLTFYESLGESKKYSFFGKNWIERRKNAFEYLKNISKESNILDNNFDYLLTKFFAAIYKLKK